MNRHPLIEHLCQEFDGKAAPHRLLVAVSGGADSMALLRGLCELQKQRPLVLRAGHLDHKMRGQAARDDADWVAETCRLLDLPCTIGRADVAEIARSSGRGIEETARDERYRFLEDTARGLDFPAVALAHTADDQAETILHHILRGTGLSGLGGIPRERVLESGVRLWRPLLEIDRSLLLDYLGSVGQSYREDESNHDAAYTRNRIRHQLLPLLASNYNPRVREALCRLGSQA